jgi:hypothetical protein
VTADAQRFFAEESRKVGRGKQNANCKMKNANWPIWREVSREGAEDAAEFGVAGEGRIRRALAAS